MTSPLQAALQQARALRGTREATTVPEYAQLVSRAAMDAPRRLKRDRPGQRLWRDYPRIAARVLLVEALFFQGFDLRETLRYVNRELVANGVRPVSERAIDLDRTRMHQLWAERPAGRLVWWPARAVYQRRRTSLPTDAYASAPVAAGAQVPSAPAPGLKIQRFEDFDVEDEDLEETEPW